MRTLVGGLTHRMRCGPFRYLPRWQEQSTTSMSNCQESDIVQRRACRQLDHNQQRRDTFLSRRSSRRSSSVGGFGDSVLCIRRNVRKGRGTGRIQVGVQVPGLFSPTLKASNPPFEAQCHQNNNLMFLKMASSYMHPSICSPTHSPHRIQQPNRHGSLSPIC